MSQTQFDPVFVIPPAARRQTDKKAIEDIWQAVEGLVLLALGNVAADVADAADEADSAESNQEVFEEDG